MAKYSDEADYLGVSPMAVSFGMREEKLPIGFAVHNKDRYLLE